MRVVTVLNTQRRQGIFGQEFGPRQVYALRDQVAKWAPDASFECLTDVQMDSVKCVPLEHPFLGWWAKMELFRPDFPGDFLYLDLDTVVNGPLDDIAEVRTLTMLRDFYRDGGRDYKLHRQQLAEGLGSGMMYLPDAGRQQVWDEFSKQPALAMRMNPRGDQQLLERYYKGTAKRWQDVVPGQVVSYKVHCQNGVPPDARVICFHGQPRPWTVGKFLHLYAGKSWLLPSRS